MLSPINRSLISLLNKRGVSLGDFPKLSPEVDDTGRFNRAIAASDIVLIPEGNYIVSSTITLGVHTCLLGQGKATTVVKWNGATGGTVIGTPALTGTSGNYYNTLYGFQVFYPYALITATSKAIYLAMPNSPITDILVQSEYNDNTTHPPITGSAGIVLDGCANAMPFTVDTVSVNAQFESPFLITCNHATLIGCGSAYGKYGYKVDQDSIASSAGPPYNVTIVGAHGYYTTSAMIELVRAHQVTVIGGMNEGGAVNVQTESTFTGFANIDNLMGTTGTRLVRNGGIVHYNNLQDNQNEVYGATNNLTVQKRQYVQPSQTTTTSTTPIVIGASANAISPGPNGGFHVRFSGQGTNDTANDGLHAFLYQSGSPFTVGSAPSGGSFAEFATNFATASNYQAVNLEGLLTGQSSAQYFAIVVEAVTGGTAHLNGVMVVESY